MRRKINFFLGLALFISLGECQGQNWYKGNLHTHSLWSDGDDYPEMIASYYKAHGYNFIGLTEHNKLEEGPYWTTVKGDDAQLAFNNYRAKFGSLVEYESLPNDLRVRLKTLEEYRGLVEEKGKFMLFQSEEITSSLHTHPAHMNATNLKYTIMAQYGTSYTEIMQKTVNQVYAQRKETGWKTILHLDHPNFGNGITAADITALKGLRFFEVLNAAPGTHSYGNEVDDSTEVIWDKVNMQYYKEGKPLLLGLGVDDTHSYRNPNVGGNIPFRAWIMVNAATLDGNAIIDAMEAGRFYTSTGVVLDALSFQPKKISLRVKKEEGITYRIQFIGVRKGTNHAEILKEVAGTEADYELGSSDLFVRARITSSKVQATAGVPGDLEKAWTQPIDGK
jgi:hypothetical protein